VIDARHCNAQDVSTCKGPWPTITVGNLPNGATCNGTNHSGCGQAHPKVAVGNYPGATTIDPASGTAYISNSDNTLSVIHG
jgi:DNA-binding beta-propeller fold protein YncE